MAKSYQIAQAQFDETEQHRGGKQWCGFIYRVWCSYANPERGGLCQCLGGDEENKAGIGKLDLTEILFEAIESVKENVRSLQTSLLNRVDDITLDEEEGLQQQQRQPH